MATAYATSAAHQPPHNLRREPSRWRIRLSRLIRGQRRTKGVESGSISATAPRLAPIDSKTTSATTYTSIADNFASLKFDEKGEIGDFDFNFDTRSESAAAPALEVNAGREKDPGLLDIRAVKRQSKSAAGDRTTQKHSKAPSIELPREEVNVDNGFFDSWLLTAVQEGKLAELKDDDNNDQDGTVSKRQSIATRTPIASQYATVAPPIASQFVIGSRPVSTAMSAKADSNAALTLEDKSTSPGTKRKADDAAPTSPSKRSSMIRSGMSSVSMTLKQEYHDSVNSLSGRGRSNQENVYKRHSINLDESRGRCPPVSIKRYSMGSDYGARLSVDALKADNRRPSTVPSLIDSESASSASTSPTMTTSFTSVTPARRFEIKTASLLTPVTNAIADKQNANISETITRMNNGTIPRSSGDHHLERSSSRGGSSSTANRYGTGSRSASPAGASRTTTPEPGMYPDATPRARRPSSRLSDRMSWLRELDEANGKQTGRDFVFRKMEGGVAAKLAAFEHKKASAANGTQTPSIAGRSRTNSIASRQASSELYSIESNALTRRATTEGPGSISNVVNDDFKQKLESMTGSMAEKLSKDSKQSGSSQARGPAAMSAARRKIPQDVLDFIALSGVDPEVAINEYMQQGSLGKTKEWDHDEIVKSIGQLETHEPVSKATTPVKEKSPAPEAAVEKTDESVPTPIKRTPALDDLLSSPLKDDGITPNATPAKLENARAVIVKAGEMPRTIDIKPFNAAVLPKFV